MRNEVIISDLAGAVREKDRLADFSTADRWEVVSYETAAVTGNLLIASEETMPEPVTIAPELTGWYRIYVCMADTGGGFPSGMSNGMSKTPKGFSKKGLRKFR